MVSKGIHVHPESLWRKLFILATNHRLHVPMVNIEAEALANFQSREIIFFLRSAPIFGLYFANKPVVFDWVSHTFTFLFGGLTFYHT